MEFKDLNLTELDKNLSDAEREEWQAIYASYQSSSIVNGCVVGVDLHNFNIVPEGKRKSVPTEVRCLIVIKYRVKIIIPEMEVFDRDLDTGYHVLHSMCGANIGYVITHIDREAGFAVASRKMALERIRTATARRRVEVGDVVDVNILSVGRNVCTVSYGGYDVRLAQRDISYSSVADLRSMIGPGDTRKAVIKELDRDSGNLRLSIKETTPHPFDGIETRHPIKSTRIATIIGKYAGGV